MTPRDPEDIVIDLDPAAHELSTVLDGVTDDQLAAPTPCAAYTVGDLLDHVMALTAAFRCTAQKAPPPAGESPPGEGSAAHLDPAWRTVLPQRLDALVAAWRDPAAWEGESEAGGVRAPAPVLGMVGVSELVLHGWDLARATGQPFRCDEASLAGCREFMTILSQAGPELRGEAFGPAVGAPDEAEPLDRVVGLSGRDPAWARA